LFWGVSGVQLLLLMRSLKRDQDIMESELAAYAAHAIQQHFADQQSHVHWEYPNDDHKAAAAENAKEVLISEVSRDINGRRFESEKGLYGSTTYSPELASLSELDVGLFGQLDSLNESFSSRTTRSTARRAANADGSAEESLVLSIEDRMASFDGVAARQSLRFIGLGIREISDEIQHNALFRCGGGVSDNVETQLHATSSSSSDEEDDVVSERLDLASDIAARPAPR
jgi:hypothetical protein